AADEPLPPRIRGSGPRVATARALGRNFRRGRRTTRRSFDDAVGPTRPADRAARHAGAEAQARLRRQLAAGAWAYHRRSPMARPSDRVRVHGLARSRRTVSGDASRDARLDAPAHRARARALGRASAAATRATCTDRGGAAEEGAMKPALALCL